MSYARPISLGAFVTLLWHFLLYVSFLQDCQLGHPLLQGLSGVSLFIDGVAGVYTFHVDHSAVICYKVYFR